MLAACDNFTFSEAAIILMDRIQIHGMSKLDVYETSKLLRTGKLPKNDA